MDGGGDSEGAREEGEEEEEREEEGRRELDMRGGGGGSGEGDEGQVVSRWRPTHWNCYEVVTAWVHPR